VLHGRPDKAQNSSSRIIPLQNDYNNRAYIDVLKLLEALLLEHKKAIAMPDHPYFAHAAVSK